MPTVSTERLLPLRTDGPAVTLRVDYPSITVTDGDNYWVLVMSGGIKWCRPVIDQHCTFLLELTVACSVI